VREKHKYFEKQNKNMGLKNFLRQIFRKKSREEALEKALQAEKPKIQALSSKPQSLQAPIQALEPAFKIPEQRQIPRKSPSIELQKDSLQLGLAAGYTGRSLREIEGSLNRIESQMVTKDWFLFNFEDKSLDLLEFLKKHDEKQETRFEALQSTLENLQKTAAKAPEPIKTEILEHVQTMEKQIPLTPRMNQVLGIVKQNKEISYEGLRTMLNNISISALRSLLTNMAKRTDKIERFKRNGKGWLKYKEIEL